MGLIYAALVVNPYHPKFGSWYAGQTKQNFSDRMHQHLYSKSGFVKRNHLVKSDLEWYLISEVAAQTMLDNLEIAWIQILNSKEKGLNQCAGGGGHKGFRHSPEVCARIATALRGRHRTEETKRKISIGHKGKTVSAETKAKISQLQVGKKLKPETKEKLREILRKRREGSLSRYRVDESGCWIWMGAFSNSGKHPVVSDYSSGRELKKSVKRLLLGVDAKHGRVVTTCGIYQCVNPDHCKFTEFCTPKANDALRSK